MKTFLITVTETRRIFCDYTVEAENLEEALQKAENGETVAESDEGSYEVTNREADPEGIVESDGPCNADSFRE